MTPPPSIRRRSLLLGLGGAAALGVVGTGALGAGVAAAQTAGAERPFGVTNALINQRADPWIARSSAGAYYFTASVPAYDRLVLRGASTLAGLATATERTVWVRPSSGTMGGYIWAPELHLVDDRWSIYFAAGDANNVFRVRPYVLQADGPDPMTANWSVRGRITTFKDTFSLDATTFTHRGARYLCWAQADDAVAQGTGLYLARMADASTLTGPQVRISSATLAWERRGHIVNEGPAAIIRNGRVFLTYSASATDSNYCMGLLTADEDADLLNPASWTKSPEPVFVSNSATSQWGPGHNGFTTAPDGYGGTADLLVYHSRNYRDIRGEPLNNPDRNTRVQRLQWNADGTPDFGIPVAAGALPVQLQPVNYPDRRVRHYNFRARIDPRVRLGADASFRIVDGLAGGVSLESANFPGRYLHAVAGGVALGTSDGSSAFTRAASFQRRAGLSDPMAVSFESVAQPGAYLRHRGLSCYVEAPTGTTGRADATFRLA